MEERGIDCINERETVNAVVTAPGLDQRRPFLALGGARRGVRLRGEEGWEGVGRWEGKGCCCCRYCCCLVGHYGLFSTIVRGNIVSM